MLVCPSRIMVSLDLDTYSMFMITLICWITDDEYWSVMLLELCDVETGHAKMSGIEVKRLA